MYSTVKGSSSHGLINAVDEADDDVIDLTDHQESTPLTPLSFFSKAWNALTFAWMKPLLALGNSRPLLQSDLYPLPNADSSVGISESFQKYWKIELSRNVKSKTPISLVRAFTYAFGKPFIAAGGLKLVHDTCLFAGPFFLNAIIKYLSDPSAPTSIGYFYVFGLFLSNFLMSLCLRQYFWYV